VGKRKDQHKVAEGLARGLSKREAVRQAGYSPITADKKAYDIVKRPVVQTALTEALERQGMTFDRILKPVVDALDATVVAHTLAGPVKTKLPDHRIRLEAHNRLVSLYGGTPRASEIPPLPAPGLVVIIQKEGGLSEKKEPLDVGARTKIEPQGEGGTNPLGVEITREGDDN
jgi:hypothetical protein